MNIDKFLTFSILTAEEQDFLVQYRSPDNETSVMKRVPLSERTRAMNIIRNLGLTPRSVYRGPRRGGMACWAPKSTATSSAVYIG